DVAKLKETLTAIETDDSGIERVFAAVIASVEEFQNYRRPDPRTREPRRNVMLIVLSDEAGDDVAQADEAVKLCRRNEVPVFVIGVPAPFGRQETYVKYVDPDPQFDQTPQRAIVHQGPETLYPERIRLRFSGSRDFDDVPIDSGFGPYALTRLCYESGGIYFTVHPDRNLQRAVKWGETSESAAYFKYFFDPEVMKRYRPDYVSTEEYQRRIKSSRLRTALVRAAQMSWVASMENPHLRFVKRSDAELAQELTEAQKIAAKVEPPIQMIYQTLQLGESDRQREYSPRWQAGFDLAMGRTLATKVRTEAYNVMLAQAKQGMAFKDGKNNTWVLRPSDDASDAGSLLKNLSDKAREYLNRVIDEHPGTPWSMLAAAELKDPLGWKWAETFTDLDPPAQGGGNNNNNPAPPPRDDQLQMLQRRPTRPIPRL
ncbi:MAG: VWA domain-containing protein, partial [Planctomycetales bacterium]|nr:VWA domain-containing protein [Planctomycetales bacterium]